MQVQVGQRGEIVIPKKIRVRYGIKPYTKLILNEKESSISLQPRQETTSKALTRWRAYATEDVSKWDLSKEPYDDQD